MSITAVKQFDQLKQFHAAFAKNFENDYRKKPSEFPAEFLIYCIDRFDQIVRNDAAREIAGVRDRLGELERKVEQLEKKVKP